MPDLSWKEAIFKVLRESAEPMHYTDIAEAIAAQKLRADLGATPAGTVNATIAGVVNNEAAKSPIIRTGRGMYAPREFASAPVAGVPKATGSSATQEPIEETGLINAFGMYWSRSSVIWKATPRILGHQQMGSTSVDFYNERGVYLLHDGRAVVYVGRTTDQPLGLRLKQHTVDRLNGRWDRFSWFGVYAADENGKLNTGNAGQYSLDMLIVTMEALLIEGLEPPQNRRRGDDFRAAEFLQAEDPEIQKSQKLRFMEEMMNKMR